MNIVDQFMGVISRRTFLIRSVQLPALIASLKMRRVPVAKPIQPSVQEAAYGTGLYGQGSYPGYRINLPLIRKE